MGSLQTLLAWVPTRIRSSDLSLAHSDILRRIVAKPLPNAVGKALPTDYLTSRKVAHVIFECDGILLALNFLYTPALNPKKIVV